MPRPNTKRILVCFSNPGYNFVTADGASTPDTVTVGRLLGSSLNMSEDPNFNDDQIVVGLQIKHYDKNGSLKRVKEYGTITSIVNSVGRRSGDDSKN